MTIQTACDTLANRTALVETKRKEKESKTNASALFRYLGPSYDSAQIFLSPSPSSSESWCPTDRQMHFLPPIFTEIHCSTPWCLLSSDHSAWNQISDRFLFSVKDSVKVTEFFPLSRGIYSAGK